jgi:hypothetical protein
VLNDGALNAKRIIRQAFLNPVFNHLSGQELSVELKFAGDSNACIYYVFNPFGFKVVSYLLVKRG